METASKISSHSVIETDIIDDDEFAAIELVLNNASSDRKDESQQIGKSHPDRANSAILDVTNREQKHVLSCEWCGCKPLLPSLKGWLHCPRGFQCNFKLSPTEADRTRMGMILGLEIADCASVRLRTHRQSRTDLHAEPLEAIVRQCASQFGGVFGAVPNSYDVCATLSMNHLTDIRRWLSYQRRAPRLLDIPASSLEAVRRYSDLLLGESEREARVDGIRLAAPGLWAALEKHQKEGVRFCLERGGRALIADEMGVGKTLQAIAVAAAYRSEWPLLVVTPAPLRYRWAEELEKWLPFVRGDGVQLLEHVRDFRDCDSFQVTIVSFCLLSEWLSEEVSARKWGVVVVDESHNLASRAKAWGGESQQTTCMSRLIRRATRAILCSGTPALRSPVELFSQIDALTCSDHGRSTGTLFSIRKYRLSLMSEVPGILGPKLQFIRNYCTMLHLSSSEARGPVIVGGKRLDELNALLCHCVMIRRLKKDVLDYLPPKRRQVLQVDLKACPTFDDEREGELYKEQGKIHKDRNCTGNKDSLASLAMKYKELGLAKAKDKNVKQLLELILVRLGEEGKAVIFAHHVVVMDCVEQWLATLSNQPRFHSLNFRRIDGTMSAADREELVRQFRSDLALRILLVSVTAGGVGLEFTAASTVIFMELPPSSSLFVQAEDRCHRKGQKSHVSVYILLAKGSMDTRLWHRMARSLSTNTHALDGALNMAAGIHVDSFSNIIQPCSPEDVGPKSEMVVSRCDVDQDIILCQPEVSSAYTWDDSAQVPAGLMFQVSNATGRVHLVDTERKHLNISLLAEDMETLLSDEDYVADCENVLGGPLPGWLRKEAVDGIDLKGQMKDFLEQWKALRPLHRRQLLGQILTLPLTALLAPQLQQQVVGLMGGGSRARLTTLRSLVTDAASAAKALLDETTLRPVIWATSTRGQEIIWQPHDSKGVRLCLGADAAGRPCLRRCRVVPSCSSSGSPSKSCISNSSRQNSPSKAELCDITEAETVDLLEAAASDETFSLTLHPARASFCCATCYIGFQTRRGRARRELLAIERGKCQECGLDARGLFLRVRALVDPEDRRRTLLRMAPSLATAQAGVLEAMAAKGAGEGCFWQACHIRDVADGGGVCDLANLRTLCVPCHRRETEAKRAMTAAQRAAWAYNMLASCNTVTGEMAKTDVSVPAHASATALPSSSPSRRPDSTTPNSKITFGQRKRLCTIKDLSSMTSHSLSRSLSPALDCENCDSQSPIMMDGLGSNIVSGKEKQGRQPAHDWTEEEIAAVESGRQLWGDTDPDAPALILSDFPAALRRRSVGEVANFLRLLRDIESHEPVNTKCSPLPAFTPLTSQEGSAASVPYAQRGQGEVGETGTDHIVGVRLFER